MKDVIVVDLDGTLANIDHRLHLVKGEKKNFDKFFQDCTMDVPNQWCVDLINAMDKHGFEVWIVSARSRVVESETHTWLAEVLPGRPYFLEMLRAEGDHSPDVDLKRKWLQEFGKDRILFVVDDRQRVVDMWREEGLTCLQCQAWSES